MAVKNYLKNFTSQIKSDYISILTKKKDQSILGKHVTLAGAKLAEGQVHPIDSNSLSPA